MPWARIDDQLPYNEKVSLRSKDAKLLYFYSIIYCSGQLNDGFIRAGAMPILAALTGIEAIGETIKELVSASLWESCDGGWQIHDYLDYNPSREKVLADRSASAKRKQEWEERHRGQDGRYEHNGEDVPANITHSDGNDVRNAFRTDNEQCTEYRPTPTPTPTPTPEPVPARRAKARDSKSEPDKRVSALVKGFEDLCGYKLANYGQESAAAKWLLSNGYAPQDIFGCWKYLTSQPFWEGKHCGMTSVQKQIGAWVKSGKPEHDIGPPGRNGGNGNGAKAEPKGYAGIRAFMAEANDGKPG